MVPLTILWNANINGLDLTPQARTRSPHVEACYHVGREIRIKELDMDIDGETLRRHMIRKQFVNKYKARSGKRFRLRG
jgi:hypothetical protein